MDYGTILEENIKLRKRLAKYEKEKVPLYVGDMSEVEFEDLKCDLHFFFLNDFVWNFVGDEGDCVKFTEVGRAVEYFYLKYYELDKGDEI